MGFFFLCVYLIFLFIRPQDWYALGLIQIRPVLTTQILAGAATIFDLMIGRLQMPSLRQPWWIIMTGLFTGIVFSYVGNFYIGGATFAFNDFGKTYLTFILIWINLNTVKRIITFNTFLVIMAAFIGLHCVLVIQTGNGFGGAGIVSRNDNPDDLDAVLQAQFYGIFSDPNDTAQILVLALPLCIFIIIHNKLIIRIIALSILVVLVWGIIATQSRGGFISMAVTFFVFLRGYFSPIQFVIIFILGVVLFPILAPSRLSGGMVDESSSSRVEFWGEATEAFKSNPLFGVGYRSIDDYISSGHTVHNSYVQAYSEIGVFGYIFWFSAIVFAIYSMLLLSKVFPETREEESLINWIKCVVPGLAGCYTAIFFLSRAYLIPLYIIFAMVAAAYNIVSQKVGITSTNQYCHIDYQNWAKWVMAALFSIVFIYISILVLNKIM